MRWSIIFFLLFSGICFGADSWIVSQTNWDTVINQIKEGDTVYIDWNDTPTVFRACDILEKRLGAIVTKYSWGKKIENKTGYCDFYVIFRRRGKDEIIRK